jgi:hypothetical protein
VPRLFPSSIRIDRVDRRLRAGWLALILLTTACGTGLGSGGTRVVDTDAGLSYSLPSGWDERPREDLLDFFTSLSGIETDADSNGALLALGSLQGLFAEDEPDMGAQAERLAIDFAEFFVPYPGEREKTGDEAVEIDGHSGHRVALEIVPDEEPSAVVETVVVQLEGGAAFALGVVFPEDRGLERQLSDALDSLAVE